MLTLFIGLIWIGGAALSSNVVETIQPVAAAIVSAHQFELVDLEFVREGQSWYLRLYIDKPGGINIEECAMVSDELSEKLDAMEPDPIPQAYFWKFLLLVRNAHWRRKQIFKMLLVSTCTLAYTRSWMVRKFLKVIWRRWRRPLWPSITWIRHVTRRWRSTENKSHKPA